MTPALIIAGALTYLHGAIFTYHRTYERWRTAYTTISNTAGGETIIACMLWPIFWPTFGVWMLSAERKERLAAQAEAKAKELREAEDYARSLTVGKR